MRVSVDIDEEMLARAMKLTGETKKGPAIVKAATQFIRRELAKEFARKVMDGEFADYPMTNDEIEEANR
ncbi:MAG: type II toxin-antitoxin system VapB family antitoxin [Verrucomicrobia bacterium]|jgi:Arc/MetJ family transcription regulator|nr:type II toxin-antitoxin system VapB family antitoxin [Verrucomicrobiota bacterium]MDA1007272.1 type II toxin-antitoxin system VapB family antitoxin [Verrucomicrobiota bacterium]